MMDDRTFAERTSDAIARFGGSWTFIIIATSCIMIWVFLNTLALFGFMRFDPYPFILLNLFLSLVAALQAPFIMMSQRRCEMKQDMAYRGLFAEMKTELVLIKGVLHELTDVLRDLKCIVQHQASTIEAQADTIDELSEE